VKNGWQTKRLGEICAVDWGNTSLTKSSYKRGGKFLAVSAAGCDGRIGHKEHEKYTPVLSAIGAQCGRMFFPEEDFTAIKNTITLTPKEGTCTGRFLFQLLTHVDLPKRGAAQPFISKGDIQAFRVSVPPLTEQQRIVQKLDEAFAGIAKAKENAEKNLQNARALFESHLETVFTQRGPGWADKKLEEVCGFQNGFAFKSNTFKTTGAPIIRISNIQEGRIDTENRLVFFNPKDYGENLDRYRIVKDDLLIAMSGATTGKLGFNTEDTTFYLNQRVGKFEPGKHLDKRYLYYFLSTRVEENLRISAGAAQPNLSTEQIKGFVIPLPSINEQKRIVERLDNLADQAQRLARLYDQKLEALESLKKSILHEAFSGNL